MLVLALVWHFYVSAYPPEHQHCFEFAWVAGRPDWNKPVWFVMMGLWFATSGGVFFLAKKRACCKRRRSSLRMWRHDSPGVIRQLAISVG